VSPEDGSLVWRAALRVVSLSDICDISLYSTSSFSALSVLFPCNE
jgi:hypothetical protein